ncbi:MAG TPA: hypothetical protein DCF68_09780 [Cyanothece sp. UBA12306]|nr:hypothetical protein [Cyanothece sp. UBA12306]
MNNLINYHFASVKMPLKGLSIQQQLEQQLLSYIIDSELLEVPLSFVPQNTRSLSRLSQVQPIIYRWAIAKQLSLHSPLSTLDLAEQIFSILATHTNDNQEVPQLILTMKLVEPGWLDFQLSDRALAIWLQYFPEGDLSTIVKTIPLKRKDVRDNYFDHLLLIEYAHARCSSLLRLGEQQKLIKLKNHDFNDLTWLWQTPNPIPWLIDGERLRLTHRAELALISQIITTIDRLANNSWGTWQKLTQQLSESFLDFERYCRIFGALIEDEPQLSQVRLGLIAISQYLLQWLWSSHIGTFPRSQL